MDAASWEEDIHGNNLGQQWYCTMGMATLYNLRTGTMHGSLRQSASSAQCGLRPRVKTSWLLVYFDASPL